MSDFNVVKRLVYVLAFEDHGVSLTSLKIKTGGVGVKDLKRVLAFFVDLGIILKGKRKSGDHYHIYYLHPAVKKKYLDSLDKNIIERFYK